MPTMGSARDAGFLDLLNEGRKRQLAPRSQRGFPGLDSDPTEKAHEIVSLVQYVHGAAADTLEIILEP